MLRRFQITDAVEGPFEVRLELAERVRTYGPRLRLALWISILGTLLAIVSSTIMGYGPVNGVWEVLVGETDVTLGWLMVATGQLLLIVFIWGNGLTVLIFLGQTHRFVALLGARYGTLERMGLEEPPSSEAKKRPEPSPGERPPVDPAQALLHLAVEAEEQGPQLERMLKYSMAFTLILGGFLALQLGLAMVGISLLPGGWVLAVISLQLIALLLVILSQGFLVEAQRFFRFFTHRHRALKALETASPEPVPSGTDALTRYLGHLVDIGEIPEWEPGEGERPMKAELEGASGARHPFDAALGDEEEQLLVRVFPRPPDIDEVTDLRTSAEDVSTRTGFAPRHIIALVDGASGEVDLTDEVYEFVMENPIEDPATGSLRTVQIVIEVEGYYSLIPFTYPED
jgi:hypothetical protein